MNKKRILIIISTIVFVFIVGVTVSYNLLAAKLAANNVAIIKDEEGVMGAAFDTQPDEAGIEIISEEEYNKIDADADADADISDDEFRQAIEDEYQQAVAAEKTTAPTQTATEEPATDAADETGMPDGDEALIGGSTDDDIYERVEINDRIYNVLLMGDDARINEPHARSDSIILISYNRDTNNISLTSFSRDMLVPTTYNGRPWNRINRLYGDGGPGRAINMINYIFTLDLQRYAIIRFASVFELVDQLGGLDLELKRNEAEVIGRIFPEYGVVKEGLNHMNGRQVLAYARMRKIDSELQRTARQRYVVRTAISAILESRKISDIAALAGFALEHVDTNVPLNEIISMGYEVFSRGKPTISELRIPIDDSFSYASYYGASILLTDLPKNIIAVHNFIYGNSDGIEMMPHRKPPNMGHAPTTAEATETVEEADVQGEEEGAAGAEGMEGAAGAEGIEGAESERGEGVDGERGERGEGVDAEEAGDAEAKPGVDGAAESVGVIGSSAGENIRDGTSVEGLEAGAVGVSAIEAADVTEETTKARRRGTENTDDTTSAGDENIGDGTSLEGFEAGATGDTTSVSGAAVEIQ